MSELMFGDQVDVVGAGAGNQFICLHHDVTA